ncbi:hypothetical protein SK128_012833 [Halocaridina rubra]|uniref:Uncharacterized protein n=1 Tax=Halocaridina rubra TaxID=373956 RepID=A0AAN8ZV17_HALRR
MNTEGDDESSTNERDQSSSTEVKQITGRGDELIIANVGGDGDDDDDDDDGKESNFDNYSNTDNESNLERDTSDIDDFIPDEDDYNLENEVNIGARSDGDFSDEDDEEEEEEEEEDGEEEEDKSTKRDKVIDNTLDFNQPVEPESISDRKSPVQDYTDVPFKHFDSFSEFSPGSWLVVGPPGSGKTAIIRSFFWHHFTAAKKENHLFLPNYTTMIGEELDSFKKIIPEQFISNTFKLTKERSLVKWLNENWRTEKDVVVVYDDIGTTGNERGKANKLMVFLSEVVRLGSRHFKANFLITTQYFTVVDTTIRASISYMVFILKMSDVLNGSQDNAKNIANVCKADTQTVSNLLNSLATRLKDSCQSNDRHADRIPNCFYRKIVKKYARRTKAEKRRFSDGGMGDGRKKFRRRNSDDDDDDFNASGGKDDYMDDDGGRKDDAKIQQQLSVVSMMESIAKINPKAHKILSKTKNINLIKDEYVKARALLTLRNKTNMCVILYDMLFFLIEALDTKMNTKKLTGLSNFRVNMPTEDRNREKDILDAVIECYAPSLHQPSPLIDLVIHTLTILCMANFHNCLSISVEGIAQHIRQQQQE